MRVATDHRELILATAARLFARKPFHEVLMDEVAEAAGIAKGTIYRHYANKDELFTALALSYMEKLTASLEAAASGGAPPLERLHAMITAAVREVQERSDFFQVMQRNECNLAADRRGDFMQRRDTIRACFVRVIEEAIARGDLRCPFPTFYVGDMIMGMIRTVLRFNDPQPQARELADMILFVVTSGLGANAAAELPHSKVPVSKGHSDDAK
ncbi:MAG TPA: TetR/AcrR family transcriptional regulator [Planctomycetota bacterium]|nr:TetR/AcrR family transcriptional regulator [Planctomycetota bacterium]